MKHSGGISHRVEVNKGKAPRGACELVQHQPDILHCRVLGYGLVQAALTAYQTQHKCSKSPFKQT